MNFETAEELFLREQLRRYSRESELVDELATLNEDVDALDGIHGRAPPEAVTHLTGDYLAETEYSIELPKRQRAALCLCD